MSVHKVGWPNFALQDIIVSCSSIFLMLQYIYILKYQEKVHVFKAKHT